MSKTFESILDQTNNLDPTNFNRREIPLTEVVKMVKRDDNGVENISTGKLADLFKALDDEKWSYTVSTIYNRIYASVDTAENKGLVVIEYYTIQ